MDATDEDLREFRIEQRRLRRRNAALSALAGALLIPIAIVVRRWALALDAEQAASRIQFELPTRIIAGATGALILGAVCLVVALVLFVRTLGGERERT